MFDSTPTKNLKLWNKVLNFVSYALTGIFAASVFQVASQYHTATKASSNFYIIIFVTLVAMIFVAVYNKKFIYELKNREA